MKDQFDPEVLDQALAQLADSAQVARDSFLMGDIPEGREAVSRAISALAKTVNQLSLLNRK